MPVIERRKPPPDQARDSSRCRRARRPCGCGSMPAPAAGRQARRSTGRLRSMSLIRPPPRRTRGSRATSSMSAMMLPTISVAPSTSMKRRGDVDVADAHRADDGRADGRQREDDRHLDLAGQHVGQHHALIGDQRMQRVRHGVPHDHRRSRAGPWRGRSRHIGRSACRAGWRASRACCRRARRRSRWRSTGQTCCTRSTNFAQRPGRPAVLRREEAAEILHVQLEGEDVENDQRQQEARDGHAEEGDEGESVVSTQLYCRVAARMPRLMPKSDARMWQVSARSDACAAGARPRHREPGDCRRATGRSRRG